MQGYLVVTRTFHQPGASEPVDAQRLTLSSAPFVVLTCEVRWHAGLPYGYLHLSSTRGQTSPLTWRDRHRLLHLLSSRDSESGGRRRYLMVIRAFCQPRGTILAVSGWCWLFGANHFQNFCRFFTLVVRRHSSPTMREILLRWAGTIDCDGVGKCRGCPTLSISRHWNLLTLLMPFLFFLNGRFHWWGYWPAEWCSTRTKLVSYLYFAFISNKR